MQVNPDQVWDYVIANNAQWHSRDMKLIYMTRRHQLEDISLIIDAKDPDILADFLLRRICNLEGVRGITLTPLTKMRFFPVPADRPSGFTRFTITIDAIPMFMHDIYEGISSFSPGGDVNVNYVGYSWESFTASILVSVLARSRDHVDTFIEERIKPLKGVMGTEVASISKTTRLVSPKEWQESIGPYFVAPGGKRVIDISDFDDSLVTGGC